MKCHAALALACITLAAREQVALAQIAAPQPSQIPTLSAHSALVLVPALVRTKPGDLVFTLTADDFVLTDDGIPQKLTLEQDSGGEPLALVVAIEIGGAGAREFDKLGALAPMIESVVGNVPHKIAIVAFDSQPTLQQDFTPDIDEAAAAIRELTPGCSRQHHLDNCAAPGSIHDLGLGDNGAAIPCLEAVMNFANWPAPQPLSLLLLTQLLSYAPEPRSLFSCQAPAAEINTHLPTQIKQKQDLSLRK